MAEHSPIEWTDHTFNPWWGCVKVSPGCQRCYAETWANRYNHDVWGKRKDRRFFSDNHWRQPLRWNAAAESEGRRARVFCASMADVFEENPLLVDERDRLWRLIEATPWLDWLLLTKRPENMAKMAPWSRWPANVWAMTSVENQKLADQRIEQLLAVPAAIHALSVEPLLGPVDLSPWLSRIDWVIVGGESGPKARPMDPAWVRAIRDACQVNDTNFFFKQWGSWAPAHEPARHGIKHMMRMSKKAAGRVLDGRVWNELPQLPATAA